MDNKRFELGANEQPLDIIKETCGFAGIFKQIGVIGDLWRRVSSKATTKTAA